MKQILINNTIKANNIKADEIFKSVKTSVNTYITSKAAKASCKGLHRVEIKLAKKDRKHTNLITDLLKQKGFDKNDIQITSNKKWLILKW